MSRARETSTDDFNALPFREKLARLYDVSNRERFELILAAPDALRLVRAFEPESLFSTVKDLGLADSTDLLALASGDQLCGMVDLDCWRKDRLETDAVLPWLETIASSGSRALGEFLRSVDVELLVLFVKRFVTVLRTDDPEEPPDLEGPEEFDLDAHYRIVFRESNVRSALVRTILEEIHDRDYAYFVTVMEEVYWRTTAELEEAAFRLRNSRLQDRGFADYFEALESFRPLRPRELPIRLDQLGSERSERAERDPTALLFPQDARSYLSSVLNQGFDGADSEVLRQEISTLANRTLVAEGADFGDGTSVSQALRTVHDTLNLALDALGDGDFDRGVELVHDHHLQHLFRVGCGLHVEVRRLALRTREALGPIASGDRLDSPFREALEGFSRRLPQWFDGLDRSGELTFRNFESRTDLERARTVLTDIAAIPVLCRDLLETPPEDVASLAGRAVGEGRLGAIFLTAFANQALGSTRSIEPLGVEDLIRLRSQIGTPGEATIRSDVRDSFTRGRTEASLGFLEFCFRRLEEEFLGLDPVVLGDPRVLDCLLVDHGRR